MSGRCLILEKSRHVNWIIIGAVVIILAFAFVSYYEPWKYYTDRYGWYTDMGIKNYVADNYGKAAILADRAIAIDPTRPEALRLKVLILLKQEDYPRAALAISAMKNFTRYYYSYMGIMLLKEQKFNGSKIYLLDATEHDPGFYSNYFHLGIVYLNVGDSGRALESFSRALEYIDASSFTDSVKDKAYGDVHAGLGFAYRDRGNPDKSAEEFGISRSYCARCIDEVGEYIFKQS